MTNKPLTVLITNVWLQQYGGTECFVRDIAINLMAKGHKPIVYSPILGPFADSIASRGIAVIDDLRKLVVTPDIIHGQHFVQTAEAIIRFPEVPAINVCHAWDFWVEKPVHFPQVRRWLAVSEAVRDRLVQLEGLPPDRVHLHFNAVDTDRFMRRPATNNSISNAMIYSRTGSHVSVIREALTRLGIDLTVISEHGKDHSPESNFLKHDLIFATGRTAIEALCTGAAVVVCDSRGLGEIVTVDNFAELKQINFGLRALRKPITAENIISELGRFDGSQSVRLCEMARQSSDLNASVCTLIDHYKYAIADFSACQRDQIAKETHRVLLDFLFEALPRRNGLAGNPWNKTHEQIQSRSLGPHECATGKPANKDKKFKRSQFLKLLHGRIRLRDRLSSLIKWS